MIIHATVIIIYLSFVLDLLIWPIPSEASTKSLVNFNNSKGIIRAIFLVLVFILNLLFYTFPLISSILNILNEVTPNYLISIVGLVISIIGRIISLKGTITIRRSATNKLVTQSIFKFSRNPISTGMHLTILGLILTMSSWYLWLGFIIYFFNIHVKIKIEERNLKQLYGLEYQLYKSKTPRYLLW